VRFKFPIPGGLLIFAGVLLPLFEIVLTRVVHRGENSTNGSEILEQEEYETAMGQTANEQMEYAGEIKNSRVTQPESPLIQSGSVAQSAKVRTLAVLPNVKVEMRSENQYQDFTYHAGSVRR
jgi:hypothetical protein